DAGVEVGLVVFGGTQEELGEVRHAAQGGGADGLRVHRDVAPAKDRQAFFGGEFLKGGDGGVALRGLLREEGGAGGVAAGCGKGEVGDRAEECVGDLGEDAGSVAGAGVGAHGTAVFEAAQ